MPESKPRPSDRFIPWYFVAAFLLLFIVDGLLVNIAVRTQSGDVIPHAFEHGLKYNDYLAEAEAQKERGWQGRAELKDDKLIFTLKDKAGKPIEGATVAVHVIRPAREGYDFALTLAAEGAGRYVSDIQFPLPGLWSVEVSAIWQNQPFVLKQDIIAPR